MLKQLKLSKTHKLNHPQAFVDLCQAAATEVREVTREYVLSHLNDDTFVLIDVRDADELAVQGYINNAYHISKGWIEADIHHAIDDKAKEIVLYCGSGKRSVLAAFNLKKMGYHNVASLQGGFKGWKSSGLPVETLS